MLRLEQGKTYRTHGGDEVTIAAVNETEVSTNQYAAGWLRGVLRSWTVHGLRFMSVSSMACESPDDLTAEVKPKHVQEFWVNMYASGVARTISMTRGGADISSLLDRIACVKVRVEFEEGEGL